MVEPKGKTKLAVFLETPNFSSATFKVIGKVAELLEVEKAKIWASLSITVLRTGDFLYLNSSYVIALHKCMTSKKVVNLGYQKLKIDDHNILNIVLYKMKRIKYERKNCCSPFI